MIAIIIELTILFLALTLVVTLTRRFWFPEKPVSPRDRFIAIGETTGRTLEEVTRQLGPPTSVNSVDANTVTLTWSDPDPDKGYHVEMQFKDGRSVGYTYMDGA